MSSQSRRLYSVRARFSKDDEADRNPRVSHPSERLKAAEDTQRQRRPSFRDSHDRRDEEPKREEFKDLRQLLNSRRKNCDENSEKFTRNEAKNDLKNDQDSRPSSRSSQNSINFIRKSLNLTKSDHCDRNTIKTPQELHENPTETPKKDERVRKPVRMRNPANRLADLVRMQVVNAVQKNQKQEGSSGSSMKSNSHESLIEISSSSSLDEAKNGENGVKSSLSSSSESIASSTKVKKSLKAFLASQTNHVKVEGKESWLDMMDDEENGSFGDDFEEVQKELENGSGIEVNGEVKAVNEGETTAPLGKIMNEPQNDLKIEPKQEPSTAEPSSNDLTNSNPEIIKSNLETNNSNPKITSNPEITNINPKTIQNHTESNQKPQPRVSPPLTISSTFKEFYPRHRRPQATFAVSHSDENVHCTQITHQIHHSSSQNSIFQSDFHHDVRSLNLNGNLNENFILQQQQLGFFHPPPPFHANFYSNPPPFYEPAPFGHQNLGHHNVNLQNGSHQNGNHENLNHPSFSHQSFTPTFVHPPQISPTFSTCSDSPTESISSLTGGPSKLEARLKKIQGVDKKNFGIENKIYGNDMKIVMKNFGIEKEILAPTSFENFNKNFQNHENLISVKIEDISPTTIDGNIPKFNYENNENFVTSHHTLNLSPFINDYDENQLKIDENRPKITLESDKVEPTERTTTTANHLDHDQLVNLHYVTTLVPKYFDEAMNYYLEYYEELGIAVNMSEIEKILGSKGKDHLKMGGDGLKVLG
jgi:hypothetical protein